MRIQFYPPYDAIIGAPELNLELDILTLWELLQYLAGKYSPPLLGLNSPPLEATDEALRARLLPLSEGRIYSVHDIIPTSITLKIFPPLLLAAKRTDLNLTIFED